MIYITSLAKLDHTITQVRPARVVSLMVRERVEEAVRMPPEIGRDRHMVLSINDITEHMPGLQAPERHHVSALLSFVTAWHAAYKRGDELGGIVFHCHMGISRSSAAAFTTLCALSPAGREKAIAKDMRRRGAHLQPNYLFVQLADEILGRKGRMVDAIDTMGYGTGVNTSDWVELELHRA